MNRLNTTTHPQDLNFLQLRQSFTDLKKSVKPEFLARYDAAVKGLEHEVWIRMSTAMDSRREGESTKSYNMIVYEVMDDMDDPYAGEIRLILYDSGIACELLLTDWLANRGEKMQSTMLGIYPQHKVMEYISNISIVKKPLRQNIALNLGPGNGQVMHDIHKYNSEKGSSMGRWNMVGLADKIYFPISGMLENFWKGDNKDVGAEVARFLATHIQYAVQEEKNRYPMQKHPLQNNLRDIRGFLERRTDIVSGKIQNNQYLADDEFDRDRAQHVSISPETQKLIRDYIKNPESFVARYFGEDFRGDAIIRKSPIYMRNIFHGDFSQIDEKFPGKNIFHFISSVRGSSHIDNEPYKELIRASLQKLAPGGLMIDDGVRRSYTAEVRVEEIIDILRGENITDIRAYAVRSPGGNIISVLFDKGVEHEGVFYFKSESDIGEHVILVDNTLERLDIYASGEAFNATLPENVYVRNKVMRTLDIPNDGIRYEVISRFNRVVNHINRAYNQQDISITTAESQDIANAIVQKIRAEIELTAPGIIEP